MINEKFVILGFFLSLSGSISYLVDTIKGKTKPNKVSWFMWSLAPLIAFTAEIKEGVGLASLMTFSVGFGPLLIFISSFINKKSNWKIQKLDLLCGLLSVVGLILWQITKIGNIAILFSLISDGAASVPTIIKAYHYPETENANVFILSAINAILTLLTIRIWNFAHVAFPLYIFFTCTLISLLIKFKFGKVKK